MADLTENYLDRLTVSGWLILSQEELGLVLGHLQQQTQELDDDLTGQVLDQVATLQATIASLEKYTQEETVLPSVATLEKHVAER